ncbi:MAG: hypothetical protein AAB466_11665 [Verrucomicrobiota bacterium]
MKLARIFHSAATPQATERGRPRPLLIRLFHSMQRIRRDFGQAGRKRARTPALRPGVKIVTARDDLTGRRGRRDFVAQISNLLFRRLPVGRPFDRREGCGLEIRDTADWKPVHLLRPCRAARIPRSSPVPRHSRQTERGILLVDCMVYIALWSVVVGLAFASFYRCLDQTRHLSRNASDIARALQAGERWREDIHQAMGELALIESGEAQELRIPQQAGDVVYLFKEGTVFRRAGEKSRWAQLLADVKESSMQKDPRAHVTAWRWEVELKTTQKVVRLRPLFTFQAVPPTGRKP